MDAELEKFVGFLEAEGKLSREEIISKMEEKICSCHGIVSGYGALYSVGCDCGVDIGDVYSHTPLSELNGEKPVSVSAKIKDNTGVRPFKKKDGNWGQYAAMTLVDGSGEIRLVLWGSHALLVEKARPGDIISVKEGSLKTYQGRLELHSSPESKVKVYSKPAAAA